MGDSNNNEDKAEMTASQFSLIGWLKRCLEKLTGRSNDYDDRSGKPDDRSGKPDDRSSKPDDGEIIAKSGKPDDR